MLMKKIIIKNIKNINSLEFELPNPGLYIITGENGIGKTTLFTCISRICNSNAYRVGFATSKIRDYDMFSGSIEYVLDDESVVYSRRECGEWRPSNKSSLLKKFGYPQVVNITTKDERVFSQQELKPRQRYKKNSRLNEQLNSIFNTKRFDSMLQITTGDLRRGRTKGTNERRRNIAHVIPLDGGKFYSEQNFSFGEIVLLNLLLDVENASNGSIILIDELEMALHPSAQINLIDVLGEIAKTKGLTIIISTHSSSIIKSRKNVILLEGNDEGKIKVIYDCPPAKAIGAIGMREDTMPDVVLLVEDAMAKALLHSMLKKYNEQEGNNYLDIRILEIGGFDNVINFFDEAVGYVFYNNVYVAAFMDKDVETDIIPYPQYGNQKAINIFHQNNKYLHFLPYTPEVLLYKVLKEKKDEVIAKLKLEYNNQQLQYTISEISDFELYFAPFPFFTNQNDYNNYIGPRGTMRTACKKTVSEIVKGIATQVNQTEDYIYRFLFYFAVNDYIDCEGKTMDVRPILSSTMKRIR